MVMCGRKEVFKIRAASPFDPQTSMRVGVKPTSLPQSVQCTTTCFKHQQCVHTVPGPGPPGRDVQLCPLHCGLPEVSLEQNLLHIHT